jgi:flagellar hook-basal body complex protein FliE
MSPLSAIRSITSPELSPLPKFGTEAVAPTPIPFSELKELGPALLSHPLSATSEPPGAFGNVLGRLVSESNEKQAAAGNAVKGLIEGQDIPLHQAVIAMEEANVSFQLMVEVRNKMLESYQELMRMQL